MAYIYCNDYLLLIGLCNTVKEGKYKAINKINWNNWLKIWKKMKKDLINVKVNNPTTHRITDLIDWK